VVTKEGDEEVNGIGDLKMVKLVIGLIGIISLWGSVAYSGTFWVAPNGAAAWGNCKSESDPGGNYCSIATASAYASAGDTVYLKGGKYANQRINPSNSGSPGKTIKFVAAAREGPILSHSSMYPIYINGKNYIVIDGLRVEGGYGWGALRGGASYNIIRNCSFRHNFHASSGNSTFAGFLLSNSGAHHNWLYGNTFDGHGLIPAMCGSSGSVVLSVNSGPEGLDTEANIPTYNTIENNFIMAGQHSALNIGGRFGVFRNNVIHNPEIYFTDPGGCVNSPSVSGYFGNRALMSDHKTSAFPDSKHNLIESNRVGHGGVPSHYRISSAIENNTYAALIRYNYLYNGATTGYLNKNQDYKRYSGDFTRFYNNTLYYNGHNPQPTLLEQHRYAIIVQCYYNKAYDALGPVDVVIKNNLLVNNYREYSLQNSSLGCASEISRVNNLVMQDSSFFTDPRISGEGIYHSRTVPDLSFDGGSPPIDGGIHLTTGTNSGRGSTLLTVLDALYFQDGSWGSSLSNIQADWIAIGTVNNVVQIEAIDYDKKIITLKEGKSWNVGAHIWLYKKSDGNRVLYGSGPDYGAFEYQNMSKETLEPPEVYIKQR
jgi:hypothetical protein